MVADTEEMSALPDHPTVSRTQLASLESAGAISAKGSIGKLEVGLRKAEFMAGHASYPGLWENRACQCQQCLVSAASKKILLIV